MVSRNLDRSRDLGMIEGVSTLFSKDETLQMFRKMCDIRFFELNVKDVFDLGIIKIPIYLSVGQESISAALAMTYAQPAIFAQHRCHDVYLSYGGDRSALIDELLQKSTGCSAGMGGSASIHSPSISMFGHDGFMGTQVPIGLGYALGTGRQTLCIMGDASAEEDYVLGALGYAAHKKAPVLFVCFDNGLSILTKLEVRRNWSIADVASSFGMKALDITDDPWLIMHHVKELKDDLPAFINIRTVRNLWHSGTGTDGPPEWDRFLLVTEELARLGLTADALHIEDESRKSMSDLWKKQLL